MTHAWLKESDDDDEDDVSENEELTPVAPSKRDGNLGGFVQGGPGEENKTEVDIKSIQGNVNYVNVDNLFYDENYSTKLSYPDYCCITEDFST